MIFDGFAFFNEFELLKLRCEELKPLNPVHILVESTMTYSGLTKPLFFQERKGEFKNYTIIPLVYDPHIGNIPWVREKAQRNCMTKAVNWSDTDTWIISDLDEIPKASAIADWRGRCASISMSGVRYFLNRKPIKEPWGHARTVSGQYLRGKPPSDIRNGPVEDVIPNAGWHFSWMGGIERIQQKVKAFAHTEMNVPELTTELWLADMDAQPYAAIDDTYPDYLLNNQKEFSHMIHPVTHTPVNPEYRDIGPERFLLEVVR